MSSPTSSPMNAIVLRHAESTAEIAACFPVMRELRPHLRSAEELVERVSRQQSDAGYRLLAAWSGDTALALAGYRVQETLIRGRFIYVDDLVALATERGRGLGRQLLDAVTEEGYAQGCTALVLDTGLNNVLAHRFYYRYGMLAGALRFAKPMA
jgi:ribosomal protein S18 acetylase RimI-like enzyme